MKITIDIRSEGGPIDASVAFVKRLGSRAKAKTRRLRLRVVRALRVPPPILPPPAVQGAAIGG